MTLINETYDEIQGIIAHVDNVVEALEPVMPNQEAQLAIAEPLIRDSYAAANELAETYNDYIANNNQNPRAYQTKFESCIRKVISATVTFAAEAQALLNDLKDAVSPEGLEEIEQRINEVRAMIHSKWGKTQNQMILLAQKLGKNLGGMLATSVLSLGAHVMNVARKLQEQKLCNVDRIAPDKSSRLKESIGLGKVASIFGTS